MKSSGKYGKFQMTEEELARFCQYEANQATLITLRKTGTPFGIPLGFYYDGDYFYVTIGKDRTAVKRIRNDPRVCLTIASPIPHPPKFVIAEGISEEIPDPENEISRKLLMYGPPDKWDKLPIDPEKWFPNWVAFGRVVFRIRVTKLTTYDHTKDPETERDVNGRGPRMPEDVVPG